MPPAPQPSLFPLSSIGPASGPALALGRFDFTRLDRVSPCFSLLEFDAVEWSRKDARARKRFREQVNRKSLLVIPRLNLRWIREPEALRDLSGALTEEFGQRIHFLLLACGQKRFDDGGWDRLRPHRVVEVPGSMRTPVFLEWGEEDSSLTVREPVASGAVSGWVLDPHWHRGYFSKVKVPVHFRLHGWHPERWMRRYGETLGREILRGIRRFPSPVLILAHSGREIEGADFARWSSA
jgi:hypothetical protein